MQKAKKRILSFILALVMVLAVPMILPENGITTVVAEAASYSLSQGNKMTLYAGEYTCIFLEKSDYSRVTDAYKWKSSNESIIGIDSINNGLCSFKAKKPGTAKLTCTYKKKTYTCTITVKRLLKTSSMKVIKKGKNFYGYDCKLVKITNTTQKTINLGYHRPESNNSYSHRIAGIKKGGVAYMLLDGDDKLSNIYATVTPSYDKNLSSKVAVTAKYKKKSDGYYEYTVTFNNKSTTSVWATAILIAYDKNGKQIGMTEVSSGASIMPKSKKTAKAYSYLNKKVASVKIYYKNACNN